MGFVLKSSFTQTSIPRDLRFAKMLTKYRLYLGNQPNSFTYFDVNMIMWKHKFVFWTSQRYHSFVSFKANKLNYI